MLDLITSSFNDSVTLYTKVSTDQYNKDTYTTSTLSCRVQHKNELIITPESNNVTSTTQIYTTSSVALGDKILYGTTTLYVLAVQEVKNKSGIVYYKVYAK